MTPTIPRISLNEGVTSLMGEERRTPEAELAMFERWVRDAVRELERLVEACRPVWPQAGLWVPRGQNIERPTELKYWPPSELLEQLRPVNPKWPEAILSLIEAAKRHEQRRMMYTYARRQAFDALVQQARLGAIEFYGRRHPNTRHQLLTAPDLRHSLSIDANYCDLVVEATQNACNGCPVAFYDVEIPAGHILWLLGLAERAGHKDLVARHDWTDDELLHWIHHPDQKWFRDLYGSKGHQQQAVTLREQFPGLQNARGRLVEMNKVRQFRRPAGGQG